MKGERRLLPSNVETQGSFYLKLGDTFKSSHRSKSPSAIITDRTKITERRFLLGERGLYERCLTKCRDGRQVVRH